MKIKQVHFHKFFQQTCSLLANFSLFLHIFLPYLVAIPAYAEDLTPTPVPTSIIENIPTGVDEVDTPEPTAIPTGVDEVDTPEPTAIPTGVDEVDTPEPTPEPTAVPTGVDEVDTPEPTPTETINIDIGTQTPTIETAITPTEISVIKKVCLTGGEIIEDTTSKDWIINDATGSSETKENVKLGLRYVYPQDTKVTIIFKCLPADESLYTPLKIQKIKSSDLKLPDDIGNLGEYAYDITTGMSDGTFEYDVTLPKSDDSTAEISYIEKSVEDAKNNEIKVDEIKSVEESKTEQQSETVKATGVDHFTIFITTGVWPTTSNNGLVFGEGTSQIRWPTGESNQSGLGFTGVSDLNLESLTSSGSSFILGTLTHYNHPVTSAIIWADLKITLNFNTTPATSKDFTFTVQIDETSNAWNLNDCTSGFQLTNTPCDDKVTFPVSISNQIVTVGGIDYTLIIEGFQRTVGGTTLDSFVTEENRDNTASLVGHFVPVGRIIVDKVTNPIGDNTSFSFTTTSAGYNNSFSLTDVAIPNNQILPANRTYSVSESNVSGWTKISANCISSIGDSENVTSLKLDAGETITCTFTNAKNVASLNVVKNIVPLNDSGKFNLSIGNTQYAQNIGNNGETGFQTVKANTIVNFSETAGTGTSLSNYTTTYSSGCANGQTTLSIGETKTCTITNTRNAYCGDGHIDSGETCDDGNSANGDGCSSTCKWEKGTLIVKKVVVNDNGGTAKCEDFSFSHSQTSSTKFESDCQNELSLDAGSYTVTEPAVTGYSTTYNNCSSVNVPAGGTVTCTITNDDIAPKLTLLKSLTDNYNSGYSVANWTLKAVGTGSSLVGSNNVSGNLLAGIYTLSESGPPGTTASNWGCSGTGYVLNGDQLTLSLSADTTCTIANTTKPATLVVKKTVINDNGGTLQAKDFSFEVNDGITIPFINTLSNNLLGENTLSLSSGTYSVEETSKTGYSTTYNNCSSLTITNGETKTCEITNNDIAPTLKLNKIVNNGVGGTKVAGDWTLSAQGDMGFSNSGDSSTFYTVKAGITYALGESGPTGYSPSWWTCDKGEASGNTVKLSLGQNATCTITNTYIPYCGDGVINQDSEKCDGTDGVTTGYTCALKTCKLIKIYEGSDACPTGTVKSPTPVITKTVSSTDADGESFSLTSGKKYLFEASGTFNPASGSTLQSDAGYTITGIGGTPTDQYGIRAYDKDFAAHALIANLGADVGVINWGEYNPNHIYVKYFEPTISDVQFLISDRYSDWNTEYQYQGSISDNSGSLILDVYECQPYGSLKIIKDSDPNDSQDFVFTLKDTQDDVKVGTTLDDDLDGTLSNENIFTNVVPGNYRVYEDSVFGWSLIDIQCTNTTGQWDYRYQRLNVEIKSGEQPICTFYNDRVKVPLYVSKFEDLNGNQTREDSERFLDGWTFELYDNASCVGSTIATAITDSVAFSGTAKFENLYLGQTYWIKEVEQDGWTLTTGNCRSYTMHVDGNSNDEIMFGNQPDGSIHGYKWSDVDGSGGPVKGDEESYMSGWIINLFKLNSDGLFEQIGSTVTDIGESHFGWYWFENLLPGQYKVCEVGQSGWKQTFPINDDDNCHILNLPDDNSNQFPTGLNNTEGPLYNFGNQQLGSVTVTKFNDVNGDGKYDEDNENTLPDWTVNLSGETKVTTTKGAVFDELIPDTYYLSETMQTGWTQTNIWCETQPNNEPTSTPIPTQAPTATPTLTPTPTETPSPTPTPYCTGGDPDNDGICTGFDNCPNSGNVDQLDDDNDGIGNVCDTYDCRYKGPEIDDNCIDEDCDGNGVDNNCFTFNRLFKIQPVIAQEAPTGYLIDLKAGQNVQCYIGNQLLDPQLTIAKENDTADENRTPGSSVGFKITVKVLNNDIDNLIVTDLPSEGFVYKPGTFKVQNLTTNETIGITEPVYHSPGKWIIGDVKAGDVLDLTYQADISSDQQPGLYKDLAYARGVAAYDNLVSVIATSEVTGRVNENLVGTEVPIIRETQNSVSAGVEKEVEGEVLGASTELPSTGADSIWLLISVLLFIIGLAFIKKSSMKLVTITFLVIFGLFSTNNIYALDSLSVRLEQPKSPTNINDLKLTFVALDLDNNAINVKCFKKGPSDGSYSQFGADIALAAPGNTSQCQTNSSILSTEGTYNFYVTANGEQSNIVSFDYKTSGPGTPSDYRKEWLNGGCDYKIHFKTADDGGKTVKVELYRADITDFILDNGSRVASVSIDSNQESTITNTVPDCSKSYYYVLRAFDDAGNGSGTIGDTVTITKTSTTIGTTTTTTGAIPVTNATLAPEEDENALLTGTPAPEDLATGNEEGTVLGTTVNTIKSFLQKSWLAMGLCIIALSAIIRYGLRKRKEK